MRRQKLLALQDDVRRVLREARIGLTRAPVVRGNSVEVAIRERLPAGTGEAQGAVAAALRLPRQHGRPFARRRECRRRGGRLTPTEPALLERTRQVVDQSVEIIGKRVNQLGLVEPSIQRQGNDRILVQVPGLGDPQQLLDILGKTAKLTFRLVDTSMTAEQALQGRPPPESEIVYGSKAENRQPYLLEKRVIVSGEELTDAQPGFDQRTSEPIVSFKFNTSGARKFAQVTQENVGRPFAIVLDDEVISAPVIREPILGGGGQISGNFTVESANNLAILLRAGALPAKLTVIEQRVVGAGLGQDSIEKGKDASYFGAALVVIFMIVTYGLFGVFASIAVAINVSMIFGILSLLNALTLPGIIGIVLTIGIAVDSNVLIYERIRERCAPGARLSPPSTTGSAARSRPSSIRTSPPSSPPLCCSSSAAGRCAAAVTLGIGIITTVFTAFTLTRLMVAWWVVGSPAPAGDFIDGTSRAPLSLHPAAADRSGRHQVRLHALPAHQLSDIRGPVHRRHPAVLLPRTELRHRFRRRHADRGAVEDRTGRHRQDAHDAGRTGPRRGATAGVRRADRRADPRGAAAGRGAGAAGGHRQGARGAGRRRLPPGRGGRPAGLIGLLASSTIGLGLAIFAILSYLWFSSNGSSRSAP